MRVISCGRKLSVSGLGVDSALCASLSNHVGVDSSVTAVNSLAV